MRVAMPVKGDEIYVDLAEAYSPEIIRAADNFSNMAYRHAQIPFRILEAARMATAVINGCMICMRSRTARDAKAFGMDFVVRGPEPDEDFYQAILANDLSGLDTRERLSVIYAQKMGLDPQGLAQDEAFWSEFKAVMTDAEIVDLTYAVASCIALGRAAHVLGVDEVCGLPSNEQHAAA